MKRKNKGQTQQPPKVAGFRDCEDCGKSFEPTRADAQYCSDACRQTAYRRRVTDKRKGKLSPPLSAPTSLSVTEPPQWVISDAEAVRRAELGDVIASRGLRWELEGVGVLYDQLQREVDRIRHLAGY